MAKKIDMTSQRCGRLLVIKENPERSTDKRIQWDCICDCGKTVTVRSNHLISGNTQSCGCYKNDMTSKRHKTHGKCRSKVYTAWCNIKVRCYKPDNIGYQNYGGKGIKLHDSFLDDFETFYAEIGDPPSDSRVWSVDRIDHEKDYEPGNIRWANYNQQAQNKGKASNNTSGFTGVSYMNNGYNEYWMAHWHIPSGGQKSKCFSIKKLGYETALKMAISAREKAIQILNANGAEYTETHGK